MIRLRDCLARTCPRLLAVLAFCLAPAVAAADTVIFRNECPVPVVVEARWVVRGVPKYDQQTLRTGQSSPKLDLTQNKVISVYDAKTRRLLFRDALRATSEPKLFGIEADPRRPGCVRLMPRRLPTTP